MADDLNQSKSQTCLEGRAYSGRRKKWNDSLCSESGIVFPEILSTWSTFDTTIAELMDEKMNGKGLFLLTKVDHGHVVLFTRRNNDLEVLPLPVNDFASHSRF
jgi:hypothetical protein